MNNWVKIIKQPKSKKWISAEYSNASKKPHKTILIYQEDKEYRKIYGNYTIYFGNTIGNKVGNYFRARNDKQALKLAM